MREMLIVILNECEGSIPVVRKAVRCHSEYTVYSFRSYDQAICLTYLIIRAGAKEAF